MVICVHLVWTGQTARERENHLEVGERSGGPTKSGGHAKGANQKSRGLWRRSVIYQCQVTKVLDKINSY